MPDYDADKFEAFCWASSLMGGCYGDWVVLDAETTGLDDDAEIIEISVLSKYGSPMIDTLVKPTCKIDPEAMAVHGITQEMIEDAPTFPEIFDRLSQVLEGKTVVIYNESFDCGKLRYMARLHGLGLPKFYPHCAMEWYAQYYGQWHDYWGNYTWQKLPGGSHRAHGDALACYRLIKEMAQPLSCEVIKSERLFPPRQIACRWKQWLCVKIVRYRGYGYSAWWGFEIKLPRFGWNKD